MRSNGESKWRRMAARLLLAAGVLALGGSLWFATQLVPAYQKMQRTGDGAAFGLGMMILLFWALPVTGSLLLSGLFLAPPARLRGLPRPVHRAAAVVAWAGAGLLAVRAAPSLLIAPLMHSQRYYGYQGYELLRLFLQNLALSLPLLVLTALLTWAGVALWRRKGQM